MIEPTIIPIWEHSRWGDSIFFFNPEQPLKTPGETVEFHGFLRSPLQAGNILLAEMDTSIAAFEVSAVKRMADPPDQFFAKASWIGSLRCSKGVAVEEMAKELVADTQTSTTKGGTDD